VHGVVFDIFGIRPFETGVLRAVFQPTPVDFICKPNENILHYPIPARRRSSLADPRDFHTPQPSYSREELLRSGEGGYFGPGNAQLPAPPMLMMDRITELSVDGGEFGKGHVVAELDIKPGLWFFSCNFPGDPVMPASLGLDAMWQVIGYWLGWSGSPGKGRAVGVGEVEVRGEVTPATRLLRYVISMRLVRRGKLAVGVANGRVFADDACVFVARDMRVGLIASAT
jgi:3-hydroxyacyl-[acyl-carrier protein] dehydratase/trans-2-decenoyl-[acyl-carrier protein] isomerase